MELVLVKYEYEYVARDGGHVSIKPDERYILISKSNKDWWHVCKDQHTKPFYIPSQYVREVTTGLVRPASEMPGVSLPNSDKGDTATIRPDRVTAEDNRQDSPKDLQPSECTYTLVDKKTHNRTRDVPKHSKKHRLKASASEPTNTEARKELRDQIRSGNGKPQTATPILNDQMEVPEGIHQQMETLDSNSLDANISNIYETMPEFESREIDIYDEFRGADGLNNCPALEQIQYPDEDAFYSTNVSRDYQADNESPESALYVNVAHLRQSIPKSPPSPPLPYAPPHPDPEGWEVHTDQESGQEYYYHPATGHTTWDNPLLNPPMDPDSLLEEEPCSPSPSQSPALSPTTVPSDWEELVDETSGLPYFYNPMSGETSWEPPELPSPYPAQMEPVGGPRPREGAPPPLPEEDYPPEDYPAPDLPEVEEDPLPGGPPSLPDNYSFSHITRASIPRADLDRSGPAGWNLAVEPDGTWVFTSEHSHEQWIKSLDDRGQTYYYLRDGSKSQWNLPEAPMAPVHCRVGNGVKTDSVSVIKNWRHTMGPVQLSSTQEDEGQKFVPTHRRHASGSDTSSTGNSSETQHQAYGFRPWRKPYYLTSRWLRYNVQNLEKAGILNKTKVSENGKKVRKNWAQSWTVLHGGVLTFHKDPKSTASGASNKTSQIVKEVEVDLRGATIGWASKDKSSKKNVLELKSKASVEFLLQYDTESIIGDWYKVLVDTIRQLEYQEPPSEEVDDGDLGDRFTDKDERLTGTLDKRRGSRPQSSGSAAEVDQKKVRTKLMKFLMKRPTLQSVKEKGYIRDNVFGCHLATLCTQERTTVPKFVEKCIKAVEKRGLDIDGLYRVSGNLAVIQKLRYKADHEELDLEDGQWEDVHVITGALKLFFRELPEPLFPFSHFNSFIAAIRTADYNAKVSYMRDLVRSLPTPNHDTMELLFGHLHKVIEYGEDNRMTVQNVAIVFGPTLLRPETESSNIAMHMIFQNQIVELILNEYQHIFYSS